MDWFPKFWEMDSPLVSLNYWKGCPAGPFDPSGLGEKYFENILFKACRPFSALTSKGHSPIGEVIGQGVDIPFCGTGSSPGEGPGEDTTGGLTEGHRTWPVCWFIFSVNLIEFRITIETQPVCICEGISREVNWGALNAGSSIHWLGPRTRGAGRVGGGEVGH